MTGGEMERVLRPLIEAEGVAGVVEVLGDICGDMGDEGARNYLWNASAWLAKKTSENR